MELRPFPSDAWSNLSDWTGGEVSASTTSGQVVLICTWANWNPLCKSAVSTAIRMADQHGGKGLIVVGAHDHRRWDDAAKKAGEGMILAVDEDGAFREALLVDQDPDFYLIDRAGNLRYADIETGSVAEATRQLVGETREDAADYPARLEREAARAAAEARRTGQIQAELDLSELPDVSFVPPQAEAYTQANWPNRAREFEEDVLQIRNRGFGSDEAPSVTIAQPPADPTQMFGRKPRSALGRVTVVYFWTPDFYPSWARIQPQMNQLQREKWRDVNVYGVLTRFATRNNSGSFNNQSQEEVEQARKRFENLVTKAKARRDYDHTIFPDPDDALLSSVLANNSGRGFENRFLPLVAIFSSDNQMRWIGTPRDSRFETALSQVLRVDPGVQARRAAEDKWIRENK
jgi:thiol-disulfide isomerase/thioredoxin